MSTVALWLVTAGCGIGVGRTATPSSADRAQFSTDDQRFIACLDLRDHIVDLYTNDYLFREGIRMSDGEWSAFRDAWAEELAKGGTFDRFERACFLGLTPRKYRCGMTTQTTEGFTVCMKLSER
jgi:hypothetical protein